MLGVWQKIKSRLLYVRRLKQQLRNERQQLCLTQQRLLEAQRLQLTSSKQQINCVVSLTSYGERIKTLHYTLVSLITQTCKPKEIIVWLAEGEHLTDELRALEQYVSFKYCKDIRSYKKLIPTLKLNLSVPIVTFDDDVIYPAYQLEQLYNTHLAYPNAVICHRAHRVGVNNRGFVPYQQWQFDVVEQAPSNTLMPIGIGGVLYPVASLADDVTDDGLFMTLCPSADDIWFKYMALKKRTKTKLVANPAPYCEYLHVANSGEQSLWHENKTENDKQLNNLLNYDPSFITLVRD